MKTSAERIGVMRWIGALMLFIFLGLLFGIQVVALGVKAALILFGISIMALIWIIVSVAFLTFDEKEEIK